MNSRMIPSMDFQHPWAACELQQQQLQPRSQQHLPLVTSPIPVESVPIVYCQPPGAGHCDGLLVLCSAAACQTITTALSGDARSSAGPSAVHVCQQSLSSAGPWNCAASASPAVAGKQQLLTGAFCAAEQEVITGTEHNSSSPPAHGIMVHAADGRPAGSNSGRKKQHKNKSVTAKGVSDSKTPFSSELLAFGQSVADDAVQTITEAAEQGRTLSGIEQMQLMRRIEERMCSQEPNALGPAVKRSLQVSIAVPRARKAPTTIEFACSSKSAAAAPATSPATVRMDCNSTGGVICYELFEQLFQSCSIQAAAHQLGLGLTKLKAACRAIGITRWPYREFSSIENALEQLRQKGPKARDGLLVPGRMLLLQHARHLLLLHPNMEFELHPASSLVQALHKQKYKRRIAKDKDRERLPG